jgi:hypothetical protein
MANQGIINAANNLVVNPANRQVLGNVAAPFGVNIDQYRADISTLTKFETKCLLIQLSNLESNIAPGTVNIGVPRIGTFKANINANTVVSHANTYFANVATVTITNSDHGDIQLGMVANIQLPSTGSFGSNTMIIKKSVTHCLTNAFFGFSLLLQNEKATYVKMTKNS